MPEPEPTGAGLCLVLAVAGEAAAGAGGGLLCVDGLHQGPWCGGGDDVAGGMIGGGL